MAISQAMSRFSAAASYHDAIHALRHRRGQYSNLPPDKQAQRLVMIDLMIGMLAKARDDDVELGIAEWQALSNPAVQETLNATSGSQAG
jgi:hypothetical protein